MFYLRPIVKIISKVKNRYSRSPVPPPTNEEEEIDYDYNKEVEQIASVSHGIHSIPLPHIVDPPPSHQREPTPGPDAIEERVPDPSPPPKFIIHDNNITVRRKQPSFKKDPVSCLDKPRVGGLIEVYHQKWEDYTGDSNYNNDHPLLWTDQRRQTKYEEMKRALKVN